MLKLGTERWSYSAKVVQTQSEADHWNHVAGPQSPHSEIPHSKLWGFMGILFGGRKLFLRKYKNWEHIIIKLKYSIHLWYCNSMWFGGMLQTTPTDYKQRIFNLKKKEESSSCCLGKWIDACIHRTESTCCIPETNTTL